MNKCLTGICSKFSLPILFLVFSGMICPSLEAMEITVTSSQDYVPGSLRAAITTANASSGHTIIHLPAGRYTLCGAQRDNENLGGDLDIATPGTITITGAGKETTFIDGNKIDRVFHILAGSVTVSGVTIENGKAPILIGFKEVDQNAGDGGAFFNEGTLIIDDCIIRKNQGGEGGDYHNGGKGGAIFNTGNLTIRNSRINSNRGGYGSIGALGDSWKASGGGGGIFNTGKLKMLDCEISYNRAPGMSSGGGLFMESDGGGLYNKGTASINRCTFNENNCSTGSNGGGIFNSGTANLSFCSISNNRSGGSFGDDYYVMGQTGGHGGGIYNSSQLTLDRCLINENVTGEGNYMLLDSASGSGGGIWNSGTAQLTNCTLSGNRTGDGKASYPGSGGGLSGKGFTLINCTIANNRTGAPGNAAITVNLHGNGGGLSVLDAKIKNCIIAGNTVNAGGKGPDCSGTIVSQGYNLIGNTADCNITGVLTGNIQDKDAGLKPLADNGGLTRTHALTPFSPAIDTGNSPGLSVDQRDMDRPIDNPNIADAGDGSDIGAYELQTTVIPPWISIDRSTLNFSVDVVGNQTASQIFTITNRGVETLNWSISSNADWLSCTPGNGSGAAEISVALTPTAAALATGSHSAVITIADENAYNSPQTISVSLTVLPAGSGNPPIGSFDTPVQDASVSGSIAVTGWAVDDFGISSIIIYRDPVSGEGIDLVYIGNAISVAGARPDIQALYPEYPGSYKAGWGYMLLTNCLPGQGNGTFTLHAIARDMEGNRVTLGSRIIHCDNDNAVEPFGTIDTPTQGGIASGSRYVNFGWALTRQPNTIPFDGSTITVWVDGVPFGNPVYNQYRQDIATLFSGYNNSGGAVGYFVLDTTAHQNGVHTIAWSVKDDAGHIQGIGSRYFTIKNSSTQYRTADATSGAVDLNVSLSKNPIWFRTGFNRDVPLREILPDGMVTIAIRPLERLEIWFNEPGNGEMVAVKVTKAGKMALPIGSSLDEARGIFRWQTGVGFSGPHRLVFLIKQASGDFVKQEILINIRLNHWDDRCQF